MGYLLLQIFLSLLAALLIGVVATWYFQRAATRRREEIIQTDYRSRLRQVELDRERSVRNLSAEIDQLKKDRVENRPSSDAAALEHDKRLLGLEERVAEREAVIAELRNEITTLRGQLAAESEQAVERETALLLEYEQKIEALETRLAEQSKNDDSEQREEQQAGAIRQLEEQHASAISKLEEQHAGAVRQLEEKLSPAALDKRFAEREQKLSAQHQAELLRLKNELAAARDNAARPEQSQVARQLQQEIQLRDDSIAVLRDDLAELRDDQSIKSRGRQDEVLRETMAESLEWQKKYEAADTELQQLKKQVNAAPARTRFEKIEEIDPGELESKTLQRTGLDRIASAVSDSGPRKDNLQAIKGIGPVLERTLNEHGVFSFQQIAEFEAADIAELAERIGRFSSRIQRDDWIGQAAALQRKHHG